LHALAMGEVSLSLVRGQFTKGDYGVPTMVLEVVASQDIHIWHAFFEVAGSNNDPNVLNESPLFLCIERASPLGTIFSQWE
jgi:hypothetical protein